MHVVIVGAGQAGYAVATTLGREGTDLRVTLVGEEPFAPYERPPLSKELLTGVETAPRYFLPPGDYASRGVTLRLGTAATRIDLAAKRLELADGSSLDWDALVLATGGRARRVLVPGAKHVRYLRNFDDGKALLAAMRPGLRLLCVGGGVIGLEVAASMHSAGAKVTVAELAPELLVRVMPAPERQFLRNLHEAAGVSFRFGAGLISVVPQADGTYRAALKDGSLQEVDMVIAGVGMERNTTLAETAGIEVAGGIVVDHLGRTSVADVYAAGEVAAFPVPESPVPVTMETWHHAINHGTAVARTILGKGTGYRALTRWWTDQHGASIHVAGSPVDAVQCALSGSREAGSYVARYTDATGRVVMAVCVNRTRDLRACMREIETGTVLIDAEPLAETAG